MYSKDFSVFILYAFCDVPNNIIHKKNGVISEVCLQCVWIPFGLLDTYLVKATAIADVLEHTSTWVGKKKKFAS